MIGGEASRVVAAGFILREEVVTQDPISMTGIGSFQNRLLYHSANLDWRNDLTPSRDL